MEPPQPAAVPSRSPAQTPATYDVYPGAPERAVGGAEPRSPFSPAAPSHPAPPYGGPQVASRSRSRSGAGRRGVAIGLLALLLAGGSVTSVVTGIVHGITTAGHTFTDGFDPAPTAPVVPSSTVADVDVLSRAGFDDLVAAVQAASGRTEVFRAVLYPTYASVDVPVDATGDRYVGQSWDGRTLSEGLMRSTSSDPRLDLATLDGKVIAKLARRAATVLGEAGTSYVILHGPDDDGSVMSAYATTDFGETVYLQATSDGTVTSSYDSRD